LENLRNIVSTRLSKHITDVKDRMGNLLDYSSVHSNKVIMEHVKRHGPPYLKIKIQRTGAQGAVNQQ
jgi:hypothetical protein